MSTSMNLYNPIVYMECPESHYVSAYAATFVIISDVTKGADVLHYNYSQWI